LTIFLVVGTRPQIIKSTPVVHEALKHGLDIKIVHTGQHYDNALSQVFFEELSPPKPFTNLNVGSGSQVYQVAEIMLRLEKFLLAEKPSAILVPGDTNSALAGALASVKSGFHLAHLEAGARSYDMQMAEEVNRRLIDHCSQTLFVPTSTCKKNLVCESVTGKIYQTGDTMFDVFKTFKGKAKDCRIIADLDLMDKEYVILTTHRAENVDSELRLKKMFDALSSSGLPVVFPIHPRTKQRMFENGLSLMHTNIHSIDPVGYIEMLSLLEHAKFVVTDSGGLQKEAFWSKTPCITIRDRTEWMETVDLGVNFITDVDPAKITQVINQIQDRYAIIKKKFVRNPFGDGKASEKIVKILKKKIDD
jgi:UDP-GlcNAc3NAcA epimerase